MNERWSRPNEIELEENADARRMRVVMWLLAGWLALCLLAVCLFIW